MKTDRLKTASLLTDAGMTAMIILSLTQLFPSIALAGMAVWVGIVCFFIVEAAEGRKGKASHLRFSTMGKELKDPHVWRSIILLVCVQIFSVILGYALFGCDFIAYDMGRTFDVLHSQSIWKLLIILPVSGWGEEIAWRGFFLDRKRKNMPYPLWALITSVLFAMGHFSSHSLSLVLYGLTFNFLCSLIFCDLYHRTDNCNISTVGHVIGNYAEVLFILFVF